MAETQQQPPADRRRDRRIQMALPMHARKIESDAPGHFREGVTKNISLAGVYFTTSAWPTIDQHESLMVSVAVPRERAREFPFSRLAGRGRVVRVEGLTNAPESGPRHYGVAVEFGDDLTVLTTTPENQ